MYRLPRISSGRGSTSFGGGRGVAELVTTVAGVPEEATGCRDGATIFLGGAACTSGFTAEFATSAAAFWRLSSAGDGEFSALASAAGSLGVDAAASSGAGSGFGGVERLADSFLIVGTVVGFAAVPAGVTGTMEAILSFSTRT